MTRNHNMVEATSLTILADEFGQKTAAEMLGISPATISKCITENEARFAVEKLAEFYLERELKRATYTYLARVPADKRDAFTAMTAALNITTTEID